MGDFGARGPSAGTEGTRDKLRLRKATGWGQVVTELGARCKRRGGVFGASKRIPRDGRHLRSRRQPRRPADDGSGTGRRRCSCETQTLQSSRHLPDDGAAPELVDDRISDVACIPPKREANHSAGPSQVVLRRPGGSCGHGNIG